MLEPAPSVTQTPTPLSPPRTYRPRPNRGPLQRRSVKGLPPPRSVSSMRTLMPLTLSSSNKYTMQAISQSEFGHGQQIDVVVEPYPSSNVAEALVKDLDTSRAPFISRSMTAGCPVEDLATSDIDADDSDSCEGGDFSDSVSDSSAAIEPPSIRTRQQSVVTAATSVSRPGSAFASPRILSPALTSSSASFSNKARQGTWFDADDDSSPSSEEQTGHPLGQSYSLYHRSTVSLSGADFERMAAPRPSVSTGFHLPLHNPADLQRPQTSMGLPVMEKPRLVDIQPSIAVPRRRSSLKRSHARLPSPSPLRYQPEQPDRRIDGPYAGGEMHQDDTARMAMLTTSCGRMIIDASRPSSIGSAGEPPKRRIHSGPQSRLSMTDTIDFGEGEPPADYVYPERPTRFMDQAQEKFDSWFEEGMGHLPASASGIIPQSPSTPGIPLPPEVLDTLRISLSCFPETMLLSSSLSIETIRTYSRKLRHRVGGRPNQDTHHKHTRHSNDDDESVFSFSSQGTKRPKRWQLSRLVSSHKREKHSLQNSHTYADNQLPRSSLTSASDSSSPTSPRHQQPMIPDWAPIKRVFPTGSDYLCDALYAHILVYNYLNTLCPMPTNSPVSPIHTRPHQSQPSQGTTIGRNQNRKVPKKAASILGMQDSPVGASSGSRQPSFDGRSRQTTGRRFKLHKEQDRSPDKLSLLSGNGGISPSSSVGHGSGGIETAVIRDLQAGLTRCIGLLVKTLEKGFATGADETSFLMEEQQQNESSGQVDSSMMRALCEVVRASESGN
ncbi:hypothetical protein QBC37DRAFT_304645 [Rhypophila decipiens]|uniref:Uncharacterized protein n=1 Tax=Rhypophila decipiens TaxID=261697 RepID=A0AAN6YHY0_9PEZI|nr:hypothetical protein QBC37DRAFT_304645 [Rhypophila decipiens]